jgi:ABC-type lipoprotein export system ATPase subunit
MSNLLEAKNLSRFFQEGDELIKAVNNINFSIKENEKIVIYGRSGSGKSTLLNLLSGLDAYTEGKISYKNISYDNQQNKLSHLRKKNMGFVYQFHHLLKEFTALENVALSSMIIGIPKKNSLSKASEILKKFGLTERLHHFPSQLSGGEKQRVAMARALINEPDLIFLDEPTGNLDNHTSKEVINYLNACANEFKSSIIVATHDPEFRGFSDKILTMDSGVFV